ncbi:hypothetical protein SAMN04488541_10819 [Thermoflexibacter ruber]|uniref:Uncharacterized protein n=2 Tax=Thermoflexibacter ruber TaxID=1003 RepID=A0A1I2K1V5_9BACT|nr:hypothetical protein SAMN04488541_10819 [Thermoflexibacter ruber]
MGGFQSPQSFVEPTIGEIYDFAKNIPSMDSKYKVAQWVDYQFFDFNTLTPKDSTNIKRKDYFKVGYDYSHKIISIMHIENEWNLGNFEMFFYYNSKFVLATVKSFDYYKEGSFLDGFFVIYPSRKQSYFISLQKLYFNDEIARGGFVNENKNFDLGNLEDISVVMILDERFFAKYIFRVSFGRLLFVSEPVYSHKGNLRLLFEHLWSYNCPENFNISFQSQLSDFDKILEKDCLYWMAAVESPFNPNYCFPLWENSGKYEYRMTFDEEYEED